MNRLALLGFLGLVGLGYLVRRPARGLGAAIALLPLYNLTVVLGSEPGASPQQPFKVVVPLLVVGVMVYGALVLPRVAQGVWAKRLGVAIVVFALVQIMSTLLARDTLEAARSSQLPLLGALLALAIIQVCRDRRDLLIVVGGMLAGVVIASALALAGAGDTPDGFWVEGERIGRVQGPFQHPNHLGGYLAIALPLAGAAVIAHNAVRPLRLLGLAALVLGLPAIYLTYSRGSIVAAVVVLTVWLVVRMRARGVVVAVLLVVLAATVMPLGLRDRFDPANERSDIALRSDLWGAAIEIAGERPVLGVGPGNFEGAYERLSIVPTYASQRRLLDGERLVVPRHAHQHLLTQFAETGVAGVLSLVLLMLVCVGAALRGLSSPQPGGPAFSAAAGLGVLAFLVEGLIDNAHPETIVLVLGLVAVCIRFAAVPVSAREPARGLRNGDHVPWSDGPRSGPPGLRGARTSEATG